MLFSTENDQKTKKKCLNKMRYCQKSNLWIGVGNPLNSAKYTGQINELPGYYDL